MKKTLLLGFVAAAFASSPVWAQEVRGVRTSTNPQFDRLVFDLGPTPVDVSATDGDRYLVEFQGTPPTVDSNTQTKLSSLGVSIDRAGAGTIVAVDRRGRSVQVFKLPGANATSSGRVILDIAKGGSALSIPPDAQTVPTRTAVAAAPSTPAPAPSAPAAAPAPQPLVLGGDPPAPVAAAPSTPAPPAGSGSAASNEEVWVSVRAIDFEGVSSEAPSRDDLLNLELNVSVAENGDLVAPRTDLPVQTLTLRSLTSDERQKGRIGGSLLQQIVERIADEYEERGKYGTRIDISKRDLERLLKDQDGRLVIRISEASESGSGTNG